MPMIPLAMNLWFPKAIEKVSPECRSRAEREADLDQASRLIHALYAYPLFLIVVHKTTDLYREHTQVMMVATCVLLMSLLSRMGILAISEELYSFNRLLWRSLISGSVAAVALSAGFIHAAITMFYGVSGWTYSVSIIWMSACTGGALAAFVPNPGLRKLNLYGHLVPGMVVAWIYCGERGYAVVLAFCMLMVFSTLQGGRLQAAYWDQLVQRFRDSERSRELEAARTAAESANRAKSFFIANMSHEIRTPLNGVIGMINLALESTSEKDRRECLGTACNSAEYLLAVINEILDFSKIEAGKLVIEFADLNLHSLVADALSMFRPQADRKGIQLTLEIDPGVPVMVRGDSVRVRQILVNLLGNALKFTPIGGVTVSVASAPDNPNSITFSVRDTGIGIPPDKQELIFEAFSQADDSTTRRFGGTGLGLTICTRLVTAMSGRIWVESEPGSGSTFHFTLPFLAAQRAAARPESPIVGPGHLGQTQLERGHARDAIAEPSASGPSAANRDSVLQEAAERSLDILLVEDNPVNQIVGRRLLEKAGHLVTLASNGREAVESSLDHTFDVILMDLQMPEMDGLEATSVIRDRDRRRGTHTHIIALTAHALPEHEESCRSAGMDGYLTKPINKEKLLQQLSRVAAAQYAA
jgi:signal transduction histidine kinase/ActR/RegA family two-component response regulator